MDEQYRLSGPQSITEPRVLIVRTFLRKTFRIFPLTVDDRPYPDYLGVEEYE